MPCPVSSCISACVAGPRGTLQDLLQPGRRLAAAGYVIYGSSTMMVYSAGQGVHGFTLDPSVGAFLLSHENIRVPQNAMYYSANSGYEKYWTPGIRRYAKWLQGIEGEGRKPLGQRYIGSLVSDFHRNLLRGGVFFYPPTKKNPEGKLRLMYEANPMAMIIEKAGGIAVTGAGADKSTSPQVYKSTSEVGNRILDITPTSIHQRTPVLLGSADEVRAVAKFL